MPGGLIDSLPHGCLSAVNFLKSELSFTDFFFLAATPSNSQIPPFVPGNLPSQNSASEMWLKMTVIYLTSLHLGVLCPHLSKLSLLTTVPSETSRCCCKPQGFPFTLTSPPGTVEICGHRQPASPAVPAVPPWCWAPLRDAELSSSLLLSPQLPFATCSCSAHTHTHTQKKSPFIHLQAFHLLPRPTPAFTPWLHH